MNRQEDNVPVIKIRKRILKTGVEIFLTFAGYIAIFGEVSNNNKKLRRIIKWRKQWTKS